MDDIETVVQGKLDADTVFQESLANLSDEEKNTAIATKRKELVNAEFKSLADDRDKNKTISEDQKKRAEKAEADLKKFTPADGEKDTELSPEDIFVLVENKVPKEDLDEVKKAAKLLGKSIPDALQDDMVQGILKKRQEVRASAKAANGGDGRGGQKKMTDAEILDNANKGILPEKGSAEAEQLFHARRKAKAQ